MVYESKCTLCNPPSSRQEDTSSHPTEPNNQPREGIYIGETSRSLHERAVEHVKDAHGFSAKSHIVKHWMNSHPSLPAPQEMEFSISARFRDCLSRQIGEALSISNSKDILLNSKAEYMANSLSRVTLKEDPWEQRERTRKEEELEETTKKQVEEFKKNKTGQPHPAPAQCDKPATQSNGPARGPIVTLGQSNRSPCSSLDYTMGRDGGQDEHPWMKWVPERVDETGTELVNGGPCHQYGGGGAPSENKYPGTWPS